MLFATMKLARLLPAEDDVFTGAVVAEVSAEMDAIAAAGAGTFAGRSRQAVMLSRTDASAAQVQAASALLGANLLSARPLSTDFDPTSACVAAAHWLDAAAQVLAPIARVAPADVVVEADNIQALPTVSPTAVLRMLADGVGRYGAVSSLVCDAMMVAEGKIPDVSQLLMEVDRAVEWSQPYGGVGSTTYDALIAELRATPLDPRRPAPDLLEDLLSGIHGCWLLYSAYIIVEGDDRDDDDDGEFDGYQSRTGPAFAMFREDVHTAAHGLAHLLL